MKASAIIFMNLERKILLYLRDDKSSIPYPNYWSLLGGHIEENETPLEALKREMIEEIEYPLRESSFVGTFDDNLGSLVYVFKSEIDKTLDELPLHEGQKLGYFNFEEIIQMKIPEVLKNFLIKNKDEIIK